MTEVKKKILLIDDDPYVGESLLMLLGDEFDTHSATTVKEGVRLFDALHPSLVVLDLHLPDKHGLEALRSIRALDRSAPVVILTGFATLEVVEESMRLGASDCVHKPFDAASLKSRLIELTDDSSVYPETPVTTDESVEEPGPIKADDLVTSSFLHDISNPLTSLLTYSAILKEELGDSKSGLAGKLSHSIHENLEYLASLTEQWRAYAQPSTAKEESGSLSQIVEHSLQLVHLRAEAKQVEISLTLKDPEARPRISRHGIVRVLVNLLQNAVEAVEVGSGKIEFRARLKGDYCEFIVKDNGKGISADAVQDIFKPRYTTKKKGSGLGLYIARNILESADGAISICSQLGRGTSFILQIPKS